MTNYLKIKKIFEENQNVEKAIQEAKYMRNQFCFYGIHTPKRKKLCKDFLEIEKKNARIDWLFLDKCYQDEYREFQYLVMDYLITMQKYLTYDDIPKLFNYVKQKQWWDTIDKLDRIIGNIGLTDNRIDDVMLKWSKDEDFWVRRIAIDHQLLRKEKTNTELLEKIIVNNLESDEFFINKAIGWSLRDYSKTNPKWVRTFIVKYKDKMAKLSLKEASKYI
ncbi:MULTISPECIES: DNA alkylation repair protein [Pasteurellaceae]|uniref:DNA alkylation repair protein n=1 Tax=Pasteurella atlantica TaxID=2827233 RepID=A0AAW8CLV6_9PAST|nr:DNA alkylation repair protein [Pasteurella atlantica]MBR0574218.1 DNA alkylation repair protein [Pasteurella atlantica]MDP8040556.1 DNA alkylation repair protein [Pasteurella atlantica]MDP8042691.1 DNA alkylation repair protein [Pasteurella atlantica]MDP8044774.1 DNA alkylation repair protein [Pasteurella atlantica]MDP8046870.1 DNA alkylation repair protein [Pasteurella atlantica]